MKILHTGDLHLGSFPGPETDGENVRFLDICNCLDTMLTEAQQERPDIAVIAGDIFHQARVWSDRGLKEQQTAVKFLRELAAICPVVVMRGTPNHDSEQQFSTLANTFEASGEVKIITEPQVAKIYTGAWGWVNVACVPGFDRGYYRAQHPGLSSEEENEVFTKAIEDIIIGLKAKCEPGIPSVLMGHFTITGANMESGQTAFFSQFEPVVYPATLAAADFDLVCFGHIHRPQQLDDCKNTFYCGAVSQLNFNDEGQERGYYIHDIDHSSRAVTSTFRPLPTRKHLTIRLNDDDVRELNEKGEDWDVPAIDSANIPGKIIRVLYDCTDEHNKAFNHGALQNYLYASGAFWVQEITPQKITITVDRRSMDTDGTPESNLTDYLTEKGMEPERIGELMELARPIIAEATERATAERHTGQFVPVEIEVKNYRNYREERFSFDPIRFCTINGSNGVGKSSLFMDAMLDALFEEPREGELTGWICNDPEARSGAIKFTFKLGDRLYRVTRTRMKSGKATLNIAELVDGEWADRSKEKIKDTQQEIENIIGMDSLTLKACALIMQDQYGLFLQADKEARMNILGSILGLGIYTGMEELAAEKATDTNRAIRTLTDKAEAITAGLPDRAELEGQIAYQEQTRQNYETAAQTKAAEVDGLKVTLNTQLEAAGRVMRLNSKITALTGQKATKEATKTTQVAVMAAADTILAAEAEITAGVAELNGLLEKEKGLLVRKAAYDNLVTRKEQLADSLVQARRTAATAREKLANITAEKIIPLRQALAREAELAGKHTEYEAAAQRLAELESHEAEYRKAEQEAALAQAEVDKLDREHETVVWQAKDKIASLKEKAAMLENSGCPDAERATCRFLKDAIMAKAAIPEREAQLATYEGEYQKGRQVALDALSLAQAALADSLYHPEEVASLRASLRSLEAAEREYQNLAAQRSELKLLEERAAELEKAVTDAEGAAAKSREELAEVERQVTSAETANASYTRLQSEIAVARLWLDKEKQLPVAREQKSAAAQRVLELGEEIEDIEKEITEARTELATEQAKTVGREELQAQVDGAEAEIGALQELARGAAMKLGGLKAQAEQAEKKLAEAAELQGQVNALAGKAAGYEELKKAFSQDGIPHNIIRSIIPIFEATATNILGQMSQGRMSVEFVTEKVLKSNAKKEVTTLDIIINDSDTGRLPYMSRSGGERVKAALSVILALSEIKSSKAGVQLGFLFIDEPPFLDGPGVQAYCDALEAIQQRYGSLKVMAITHDPAMKSRFPQSVDVVKTAEGSKVIYE
nr:exonuclease subunit SbcD [uncultured Oscillibacter sp.]